MPLLRAQLQYFLDAQKDKCVRQFSTASEQQNIERKFSWAKAFVAQYLESREQRAMESISPEVIRAAELARSYIGARTHDFFVTCIDGRNTPIVMFSRPPHVGGVLRSPAAILQGFMPGTEPGTVFIDRTSPIVKRLEKLLMEKSGEHIFYGFDSHFGCAARGQIHERRGGHEEDGGVRSDVLSKMMMAHGLLELRAMLLADGKKPASLTPTFFSYDPHSGYVTAGLEAHVFDPEVVEFGYTPEVLKKLAAEEKILCTETLLVEESVVAALQKNIQPNSANFRERFSTSLLENWKAITQLYEEGNGKFFLMIRDRLQNTYKNSGWTVGESDDLEAHQISLQTVHQKAKFLLKNLVTRYSIAGQDHHWPFDSHHEDVVVITEGGYAPFPKIDAFAVFSQDLDSLIPNTQLALELVRSSRAKGQVTDPTGEYTTVKEFKSAPVFISNKAIVRSGDEKVWTQLQSLELSAVFTNIDWDSAEVLDWDRSAILHQLLKVPNIESAPMEMKTTAALVDAVYEVFHRMRLMMRNKVFREMILRGEIILLNTIVDRNRRPRIIVPMVA